MTIRARALSGEEAEELARMTRSRSLGAGLVHRAQIVQHAVQAGLSAPEIAARMGLCGATVRFWLKRFNERGLPGLEEDMRSGRPPTYTAEERSAVIAAALSRPADRAQKGGIKALYTAPPAGGLVVCLEEMGPHSARSYPGRRVVKQAGPE